MPTLKARIDALATRTGNYLRDSVLPRCLPPGGTTGQVLTKTSNVDYADAWATPAGGGADPWTRIGLATDFTNATVTPATITGFTYTPPANTNWSIEAELLVWTTAPANLPMINFNIAAGAAQGYGGVDIQGPGATVNAAPAVANGAWNNPAALLKFSQATGGVLTASVPYIVKLTAKGRSGATPQEMAIQMRAETAGANIVFVKAGSEMRYRTGP